MLGNVFGEIGVSVSIEYFHRAFLDSSLHSEESPGFYFCLSSLWERPPRWFYVAGEGDKEKGGFNTLAIHLIRPTYLAGVLGFEPRYAEIKTPCLTAWRHPKVRAYPQARHTGEGQYPDQNLIRHILLQNF